MQLINLRRGCADRSVFDFDSLEWTTKAGFENDVGDDPVCIALNKYFILITGGISYQGGETNTRNLPTNSVKLYNIASKESK